VVRTVEALDVLLVLVVLVSRTLFPPLRNLSLLDFQAVMLNGQLVLAVLAKVSPPAVVFLESWQMTHC